MQSTSALAWPLLLLALGLAAAPADAADEPNTGGTFSAPGYGPIGPSRSNNSPAAAAPNSLVNNAAGGRTTDGSGLDGMRANPLQRDGQRDGQRDVPRDRTRERPKDGQFTNDAGFESSARRPNLPAVAPSEFQKFVELATGRLLPVFGANFFVEAADRPSGLSNVPVSADYTVGPGDELVIRAWGSIDVDYRS
ncbi:MAG: hypothetical protein H7143_01730, partial [Pseudorhodobacter sp.]|nr:hypothetical protein [Rhizobacter sp.]